MEEEQARLIGKGVFRRAKSARWVSRAFLVPKGDSWRLVVDLSWLNKFVSKREMKMETLKRLRLIAKPNDWMVTFDLCDGFYTVSVAEEDREFLSINLNGQILSFCALPQGYALSPFIFQKLTHVFIDHLRDPDSAKTEEVPIPAGISGKARRRFLRRRRRRIGCRLLPFVDDFALFEDSFASAVTRRDSTFELLDSLGLEIHPIKGYHTPVQVGIHLGLTVDFEKGQFRAPAQKLASISKLATQLLCSAAARRRQVSVRALATLGGKAQFLYLAIPAARFYLRELHNVVQSRTSWSGRVLVSKQLKRDLEWWREVPTRHNGSPIWKPVETAYLHCDSSSYGWGGVLNEVQEARGFWQGQDRLQHITWKELKAVRRTVESFLPHLRGRRVTLHEDNQAVIGVLSGSTV